MSYYHLERDDPDTPSAYSWTAKIHWMDDEQYEYPYCKNDYTYFTEFSLTSHLDTYDDGYQCTIYEHRSPNYGICEPNWPGFISPTDENTPTETPVSASGESYYSRIEQDGEYTGITLKQCPINTSLLSGSSGGYGEEHSCFVTPFGTCYDSETSDYCHTGADYSCPLGFKRVSTGYAGETLGDCEKCAEGEYCGR